MYETPESIRGDVRPDAVIAGTRCLISCYVQHPVVAYAERVAANLDLMAQFPGLSPELRTICRRLAQRWDAIRQESGTREAATPFAIDERALH